MDAAFIDRLIALVETSTLTALEFRDGEARVRITRKAARASAAIVPGVEVERSTPTPERPASAEAETEAGPARAPGHMVVAGLVGTFFRAPSPQEAPFVQVGDLVREGQSLGLIDAMKMLNHVEADRAGRVVAILAEDGADVRANSPLFQIAPAEDADV